MAHLIKELNGLGAEELEEVFEDMTADTSIELFGNVYMVPDSMACMVELLIRNYLGIDEVQGD